MARHGIVYQSGRIGFKCVLNWPLDPGSRKVGGEEEGGQEGSCVSPKVAAAPRSLLHLLRGTPLRGGTALAHDRLLPPRKGRVDGK
jgi:hypothetical protein